MGYKVDWDGENKTVKIRGGYKFLIT